MGVGGQVERGGRGGVLTWRESFDANGLYADEAGWDGYQREIIAKGWGSGLTCHCNCQLRRWCRCSGL